MTAIKYPGFWLGRLGGLVALPDSAGSVSTTVDAKPSYTRTLGGTTFAHVSPGRPLRSWSVSIPRARTYELAPVRELLASDAGPWWWVEPSARATNLLTPGMCEWPALVGAGMRPTVEGDRVVRSWLTGGALLRTGAVPVMPGLPVTGSAYIQGAGESRVGLEFLDLAGTVVATRSTYVTPPTGALERVVQTVAELPAPGAVAVRLLVMGATTAVARPAITWTTGPTEWGPGAGASEVHVSGWEADLGKALFNPRSPLRTEALSFTVTELRDRGNE